MDGADGSLRSAEESPQNQCPDTHMGPACFAQQLSLCAAAVNRSFPEPILHLLLRLALPFSVFDSEILEMGRPASARNTGQILIDVWLPHRFPEAPQATAQIA